VSRDELVLTSGTEIGALLVDGLGDGVAIECPSEDLDFLRTMSFGLLQVLFLHRTIRLLAKIPMSKQCQMRRCSICSDCFGIGSGLGYNA
jgi:hypothetical protein